MTDAAVLFLLQEIIQDTELRIQVLIDIHLADIMEQVEIKIPSSCLLQLFFKNLLYFRHVGKVIAGELVCQIIAVPRILRQSFPQHGLGVPAVISPCGIIIIDSCSHCLVYHSERLLPVNTAVIPVCNRQPHRAETKPGQFHSLKVSVNHSNLLTAIRRPRFSVLPRTRRS